MARVKSTSGSKTTRTKPNNAVTNDPTSTSAPANTPEVKVVAAGTTPAEAVAEPKTILEPRKMEVVKSEPRKNVVPINRIPVNLDDEIRRRAFEIFQQRGNAPGSESEDWLAAERDVRKRYQLQSA